MRIFSTLVPNRRKQELHESGLHIIARVDQTKKIANQLSLKFEPVQSHESWLKSMEIDGELSWTLIQGFILYASASYTSSILNSWQS